MLMLDWPGVSVNDGILTIEAVLPFIYGVGDVTPSDPVLGSVTIVPLV